MVGLPRAARHATRDRLIEAQRRQRALAELSDEGADFARLIDLADASADEIAQWLELSTRAAELADSLATTLRVAARLQREGRSLGQ